jgi:PAS domain S-box-containing protein
MCSIMTASQASYKLNERGRQFLSRAEWNAESYPWTPRQASTKFQTSLTDPEFTRRLPPEQGAAITTLSKRQALLNCRRGLANPETGERTVCNASTILLKKPHSDELLGVVVCVEPEDFSLYLQRYDNMRNTAPAAATASDWNKARLIRAITLEGDVDYVSTAWLTYTGLERADLHGQFWLDCVHPEDRNLFHQKLPTNYALAQSREREVRFRGRDGLYRWFSDRTEPLLNEEGKFVRWYSMSEDVHDLVIKRQQANTDKFLLEKILAELDVVSFTVDQTYTVSSASGTMKFDNIMSDNTYSSESMIGKNLHNFINSISPGGIPELQRCLINVMNGDSPKEIVEYAFGPRYIRTILIPHINEDHEPHSKYRIQGVVGTSIDITAAREHDEVKAQMKVMEDTNRLKSEFLANVSHELRTPIAGLTGLVELLFETELAFEQIDLLESVQSSAHTLLQIVNDILDFSKADASAIVLENMPFSILRFVDDVCKRNRVLAAKKGLQFRYTPLDSDIQLLGDTGRIRQM